MRHAFLAALLFASVPAHAEEITITSNHDGQPCAVSFNTPDLAIAWTRVVVGQLAPELYMKLYRQTFPDDGEAYSTAQKVVDTCMGAGL